MENVASTADHLRTTNPNAAYWAERAREQCRLILKGRHRYTGKNLRTGQVYFIQAMPDGPIKIGKTLKPAQRLAELQTFHFLDLALRATVEGGLAREREYHERFAEHRLRGEWFLPHTDILAEIERLKA